MKPLQYTAWTEHRASNRQRKSPQWSSIKQRRNYYFCYCMDWMKRNPDAPGKLEVLFQATYSPLLVEAFELYKPQFHGPIFKTPEMYAGYYAPIFPPLVDLQPVAEPEPTERLTLWQKFKKRWL